MLYIDQLKKNYGQKEVVKGLSLHIEKGESYGLLGPNGADKSTTISMISGLLKPVQGSITVDGINMIDSPKKAHS